MLATGEILFTQGDPAPLIYVVEEGEIELFRPLADGGEEMLSQRGPGTWLGEMGPMLGLPRSASARAIAPSRLMGYGLQEFRRWRATNGCGGPPIADIETVTILLTDLVGSTGLASRVGPGAADEIREEHFGLIREALAEGEGREVKNTGDGMLCAFESSAAAVACAVSIQQLFERRNRSADEQLMIRAGISMGDATPSDGDYFGDPGGGSGEAL